MCKGYWHILMYSVQFSVPAGYDVFGYSDDPVVCNDGPEILADFCTDFKGTVQADVEYPTLYVPILEKICRFGERAFRWLRQPTVLLIIRPGSKVTFATALYAPFIAGFGAENGNPGNFMGQQVALERITYLSPSV